MCEFVGDCFGPRYLSSGASLPQKKFLGPKQSPSISHKIKKKKKKKKKKDGAQLLLSN